MPRRAQPDGAALAVGDLEPGEAGQRLVERGQLATQLLAELGDEDAGVERLVEHLVGNRANKVG